MRLTLRTMLAYLDDILEPDDAAEIGKKIDESEFATDLVRKTRDVMRRLRLGAPALTGRGMGVDPNTVAEYLDNTMPPEQVADFERVCLESDVHLAEVSACHQVLTLVLGEPADVAPESRERMYSIPARAEQLATAPTELPRAESLPRAEALPPLPRAEAAPPPKTRPAPSVSTNDAKQQRKKPEVPEYLREARRPRWKAGLVTFAAAVAIGGVVALLVTEPELLGLKMEVAQAPPGAESAPTAPPAIDLGSEVPAAALEAPATDGNLAPPFVPAQVDTPPVAAPPLIDETAPAATPPGEAGLNLNIPQPPAAPDEDAAAPPEPTPLDANPPLPPADASAANEPALTTPDPVDAEPESNPLAEAAVPTEQPGTEQPETAPSAEQPAPLEKANRVGIYVFDKNILLRPNPQTGEWTRISLPSPLASGEKLLSLPTFRNTINLSTGMTLQMVGGTELMLGAIDPQGVQEIELLYGRIVLLSVGREGTQVRVKLGDESYLLGFGEAGTSLAIELKREHVPGEDPEAGPAPIQATMYVASGEVTLHAAGAAEPVALQTGDILRSEAGRTTTEKTTEPLPAWITAESLSVIDRKASLSLEEAIAPDRPLVLSLAEMVNGRRLEVRALAARCSVYLGEFEPFVAALNDADQHARWTLHIETLREALALGPHVAKQVRDAFQRRRGEDGAELYRMLWGYSDADLNAGDAQKLVKYLDHDSLDFRVLAFWNLQEVTGYGLNYRPEYLAPRRQASVRRWQERLAAGDIHRAAPEAAAPAP